MNISGIQREQAKSRSTFSESWVKVSFQPREAPGRQPTGRTEYPTYRLREWNCPWKPGLTWPADKWAASPGMTEVGSRENF